MPSDKALIDAYFTKAKENYGLALLSVSSEPRRYNGAASRMYYAVFQAIIARLALKGISADKAREICGRSAGDREDQWRHDVVTDKITLAQAGISTPMEQRKVIDLRNQRIIADYKAVSADPADVIDNLRFVGELLQGLGVI